MKSGPSADRCAPGDSLVSGGARQAALLLHAMSPSDRAWMLDALPQAQREALRALLSDLEALGIPSDPSIIAEATASASPARHALPSDEDVLRTLDGERIDAMVRLMRAEPAGLIAESLRLAGWPWHKDLLSALDPQHRRQVEAALSSSSQGSTPPALRAALAASIVARLREPAPRAEQPRRGSPRRWPFGGSLRGLFRGSLSRAWSSARWGRSAAQ